MQMIPTKHWFLHVQTNCPEYSSGQRKDSVSIRLAAVLLGGGEGAEGVEMLP